MSSNPNYTKNYQTFKEELMDWISNHPFSKSYADGEMIDSDKNFTDGRFILEIAPNLPHKTIIISVEVKSE